jgi:hypothetical protein
MPQPSMTRYTSHLETTGKLRTIGISLPLVRAIADDPAYRLREGAKPRIRHRNPSMRSLVKLALACDSAEQIGAALRKRFDRGKARREPTEAELAELDRLMGGCPVAD